MAVARVEWTGILRSHPFRIFIPTAAGVVLGAPLLVIFAFEEQAAMVVQVGLSTALVFATLLALSAGASSVARDRQSGLRDLLLTDAVSPWGFVVGKWLGITAAVILSVGVLGGVHLLSVWLRGGAPHGFGPLFAALTVAAVQGGLAAAAALLFSTRFRSGPAFLAGLLLVLAGHAAGLLGESPPAHVVRFLLPRMEALNLASEAAFGPFTAWLWLLAALHGLLYTVFLLALAGSLAARRS